MKIGLLLSAIIVSLGFGQASRAADLSVYTSSEGKDIIKLDGEIVTGDTDRFKALVKVSNDAGRAVSGIRLNSLGGSLLEGAALAAAIRFAKMATVVANGKVCASACFLAFAGGSEKFVSYSAQVGVHGASDQGGRETIGSEAATVGMARIAKELGVPASILGRMVVTAPSDMVWLSPDDLRSMGTTITGKPKQVAGAPASIFAPQTTPTPPGSPSKPSWASLVAIASDQSRAANGGRLNTGRVCQPEFKVCTIALYFKGKDGTESMIRTTEDADGKVRKRDLCSFNDFGDIRTCLNWDTGAITKDMKNARGDWISIEGN